MQNKRLWWLMLMVFAVSVTAVHAQVDTIYGLVSVDNAEVRVGPDFAYDSVGRLPRDASVVVLGRAGDFFERWDGRQWLQIDYGTGNGWIYARLLRTSVAFNSIPPTGRALPRDANGRVPDVFDLSTEVCSQWQGDLALSGNFIAGDEKLVVTYPGLTGANVYSVIVISPSGVRRAFDSETTTSNIIIGDLPQEGGTYTWRVAPYWTNSSYRYNWQQVCLLRTGGTFEKPDTSPKRNS
jgi:SH3 domain-containing protein